MNDKPTVAERIIARDQAHQDQLAAQKRQAEERQRQAETNAANLSAYSKGVLGELTNVRETINAAIPPINSKLPDHLKIAVLSLIGNANGLFVVSGARFFSLGLVRINNNGWLGLELATGACALQSETNSYQPQGPCYRLSLWANYGNDGFRWFYRYPLPCRLDVNNTGGVHCGSCGKSATRELTNAQLVRICLDFLGQDLAPEVSPAPYFVQMPQRCHYKPPQGSSSDNYWKPGFAGY